MTIENETKVESERQVAVQLLYRRIKDLEALLVEYGSEKRQAVAQKLKHKSNLEDILFYLSDHEGEKISIKELGEEFPFIHKVLK